MTDGARRMDGSSGAREGILARIRASRRAVEDTAHPGALDPAVQARPWAPDVIDAFARRLEANGGEVVRLGGETDARRWLAGFCREFPGAAVGADVPPGLRPDLPALSEEEAPLGVSMALGASAQTGSLLLTSREGRRLQLLPGTHLVWVRRGDVVATLGDALAEARSDLPAALALHSGPSKSADIGRVLVTGVHGPARLVAAVVG